MLIAGLGTAAHGAACASDAPVPGPADPQRVTGARSAAESANAPASPSIAAAVSRGAGVFQMHCALCHGADARGRGRAAHLYDPPPADLTRAEHDDAYREQIIRKGGAAVGRSSAMPEWTSVLQPQQMRDLLAFVRTLRAAPPARDTDASKAASP